MRRRWIEILAPAYALFVVYSSLIPFDFSQQDDVATTATYFGVHVSTVSLPDAASNIALYLPFGLLFVALFARRGAPLPVSVVATLVLAGAVSFSVELLQTFLASRVSSISDVVCNLLGTGIGLALFIPESALSHRWARALRDQFSVTPTVLPPAVLTLCVILAGLAPFDLTFDVSHVGKAVRNAHVMPFAKHRELLAKLGSESSPAGSVVGLDLVRLWDLRLDYVAETLMFFALGLLVAWHLRATGHRFGATLFKTCGWTTSMAVLITGAGLVVMSVGFDATGLVTRTLGGLAGIILYAGLNRTPPGPRRSDAATERNGLHLPLRVGIAACILYIAVRQLAPFRIDTDNVWSKITDIEWLPFHGYSLARVPIAAEDIFHKSFRFITLGVLLALWWLNDGRPVGPRQRLRIALAATLAIAVLELAQCLLPGRVPSVTDCLIAGLMTRTGVALGELLYAGVGHVQLACPSSLVGKTPMAPGDERRSDRALLNVEFPPPRDDSATAAPRKKSRKRAAP